MPVDVQQIGPGVLQGTMTPPLRPAAPETRRRDSEEVRNYLAAARERFHAAAEAESARRAEAVEDQKMRSGDQWPEEFRASRRLDKRPCLTINRLAQPIKVVVNQIRQSRITMQVNPVDDYSDPDTAEIITGMIRNIEDQSHASVAYETAAESAAVIGWGYFRVLTEYEDDESFDQVIRIERILNPFSVYIDPASRAIDMSDARYAFIVEDVPRKEFERIYGKDHEASLNDFESIGDHAVEWYPEDSVRVAEYWCVEYEKKRLALVDLGDGKMATAPYDQAVALGAAILDERDASVRKVKWSKITAAEVLEEREWPGRYIPIIPVIGDELVIDGKRDLRGMVRDARGAQHLYNFMVSAEAEAIGLSPRVPWVGYEGQFEGHEDKWETANVRNWAYLEVKPLTVDGQPAALPQRQAVEAPIQAIVHGIAQADNDLKATTGLWDASLGERGPEQSGKAILARQRQGEVSNSNFADNLARSLTYLGKILIDLIPRIYDAPRVLRIVGLDDQAKTVRVNQPFQEKGVEKLYDLTVGRYDVTVTTGQAFSTRRQEAAEMMTQFAQADPTLMQKAGDLILGMMDWPGARSLAERLKKFLPPQAQDEEVEIPPAVQAQLAQMQQEAELLKAALAEASQKLEAKALEMESRERIAQLQAQVDVAIAESKVESMEQIALLRADMDRINRWFEAEQRQAETREQREHEAQMAQIQGAQQEAGAAVPGAAHMPHGSGLSATGAAGMTSAPAPQEGMA